MEKKKVLLIGDSIRMGYDKYVKNYLADSCKEYYSDMTHLYTLEGTQLLTDAVIKVICDTLDIEYREFTLADYESDKEVIGL